MEKEIDTITDVAILRMDNGQLRLRLVTSRGHRLVYDCDTHEEIDAIISRIVANSHKYNN